MSQPPEQAPTWYRLLVLIVVFGTLGYVVWWLGLVPFW